MSKVFSSPYLDRKKSKGNGEAGRKAEKKLSKRLNGKQRIGSGSLDFQKGDIKVDEFLIESKSTINDSFSIKINTLAKIKGEALRSDKNAALAINFTDGNGNPLRYGSWVCIEESLFQDFLAMIKDKS